MKKYEAYLQDESERFASEMHKELAQDIGDGLSVTSFDLTQEEQNKNGMQVEIIGGIHATICNLLQIENIDFCCGGGIIHFDRVIETIGNQQTVNSSPKLSREKLLALSSYELSEIIVELFLDRENWSKQPLYSTVLTDGEGNWLI